MKNREYRALLAVALMVSLAAGSVKGTTAYVRAEDNKPAVTTEVDSENEESAENESASEVKARKDETVYVKLDGAGNKKSVTVSDQLKNVGDLTEIEDISELTDIENVKGDETFTQADGKLVWNGDKEDICYQGTTDKELPVGIKISYQIDGKDVSAEELEGKSGHVSIRYEYQNTTGEDESAYTPFLMITGLILDDEKFSNVTIENGKLVSDGERDIAIGMGIPKMKEALGVEDIDIPDYFVIEADVTDYEAVEGITVATNEVFNELSTDKFDDIDDLKDAMNELQDAANQLVDGSGQLKDGLDTLLASSGTLIDGIDALASGGNELAAGTGTLLSGAGELAEGSKTLASGTGELAAGAKNLNSGASQVAAGAQSASDSVSGKLLPGVQELQQGVTGMQGKLEEGTEQLTGGADQLKQGIEQAAAVASQLDSGIEGLANGASGVSQGLNTASQSALALEGRIDAVADSIPTEVTGTIEKTVNVDNGGIITELQGIRSKNTENRELCAELDGIIKQLQAQTVTVKSEASATIDSSVAANLRTIADGVGQLGGNLSTSGELGGGAAAVSSKLNGDVKTATAGLNSAFNSEKGLVSGVKTLNDGIGTMVQQVEGGTELLSQGVNSIYDGTGELSTGLASLSAGASQVSDGSKSLSDGAASADAGAKAVSSGAGALASGAAELNTGAKTLASGLGTLQSGSGALLDGVQQLDDGAAALNEGMIQFNEEGIERLVSVFDGDIDGLLDKVNEMLDASKAYKNFSGISEEMDGEVKFIFVSDK